MKNIKGIIIGLIVFGAVVAGIIYWQANKEVDDPTKVEATATYRVDELMEKSENAIIDMNGEMIEVTGIVLANETDETSSTITLGMSEMEVIICQMDNRYLENTDKLTKGHFVKFKGKLTGQDFDEMLGKTIQMKNCVLSTQQK